MTDFGDVFMRELQSCKFAVVDGDKKEIRAYAKKKRLNSDYNIKLSEMKNTRKFGFTNPGKRCRQIRPKK